MLNCKLGGLPKPLTLGEVASRSDDGEGKATDGVAGPLFSRCSRRGEGKPASENSAPLFPTAYDKVVSPISRFLTGCICYTLPKGGGAYPHGDLS